MNAQAQAWSQFAAKVQRVCPRETREITMYASANNLLWSDARDALEEQKGREYVYAETMDGRYRTTGD